MNHRTQAVVALFFGASITLGACGTDAPRETYFDRQIQPILAGSCSGSVAPCHQDDGSGFAQGNLDLTTFENVQKRRDVLQRYGAFPEPLLLMKGVASRDLVVSYRDEYLPLEIQHAGGSILQPGTNAYLTLKTWLDNGATENGLPPIAESETGSGSCSNEIPPGLEQYAVTDSDPGFASFSEIESFLVTSCAAGTCHGSPRAGYRLTCGTNDEQTRANYLMSRAFIAENVDDSPLLFKALDPTQGGEFHSGGVFYRDRSDGDYERVREWAEETGSLESVDQGDARAFFEDDVMPIFLQRGCAVEACHSPVVPFKVNLRAGAQGFFSALDLNVNYEATKKFLALESPDPVGSRIVAKNIIPSKGGIVHRAGAVFETPGHVDEPRICPQPYVREESTPLCTIAEWRRLERLELPADALAEFADGSTTPIVYVSRPADAPRFVDFHLFSPGADLIATNANLGPNSSITSISGEASLLDGCPGVGAGRDNIDVRRPAPSYDGTRVVFSMRIGEADGQNLYEVGVDGSGCRALTTDGGTMSNGMMIENFDPIYVKDGDGTEWIVYASTRGENGPVRTPKHFLPGSDIWRRPLAGGEPEQLTFLRGVEANTWLTLAGKVNMSVEKSSAEYYQIGARRLNWDRSDYHPQLGQRREGYQGRGGYLPGQNPADVAVVPSIGYSQATQVRQAANGNFLVVLADEDARGGGALGIFNRSVGPFEAGRDDPSYVKSLTILPGASGRSGDATGAYRSPYPLPDQTILVSYAAGADVGSTAGQRYDLVIIDPVTKETRTLRSSASSIVDAVLVSPRPAQKLHTRIPSTGAEATKELAVLSYNDVPLLATLQGANDRRGRRIDDLRDATRVSYFTQASPPPTCTTPSHPDCATSLSGTQQVYESRVELGSAPLLEDGSVFVRVPTNRPIFLELLDENNEVLYRMQEATQFGPYENINLAVPEEAYPSLCAVCHGSVSGRDLDITVDVDVVSTASQTLAREAGVIDLVP